MLVGEGLRLEYRDEGSYEPNDHEVAQEYPIPSEKIRDENPLSLRNWKKLEDILREEARS